MLMANSNEYMNDYMKKRYAERRALAIKILGGECVRCGSTDRLEFDHVDPSKKSFSFAKIWSGRWEKFLRELKKAQLLCKTCHVKKTRSEKTVEHGGGKSGRRNCKCAPCKAKKAEYMRSYKRSRY